MDDRYNHLTAFGTVVEDPRYRIEHGGKTWGANAPPSTGEAAFLAVARQYGVPVGEVPQWAEKHAGETIRIVRADTGKAIELRIVADEADGAGVELVE